MEELRDFIWKMCVGEKCSHFQCDFLFLHKHTPHFLHFFTISSSIWTRQQLTHITAHWTTWKKIALYLHSPWFWVPKQNWFQYGRSINHSQEFFFQNEFFPRKQRLSERRLSIIIYELHYLIHAAKHFHFDKIHNSPKWHVFTLNVLSATQYVYTHWFANYSPLKCVN